MDLCFMDNTISNECTHKILWVFDFELRHEQILLQNIKETEKLLTELIELKNTIRVNQFMVDKMHFDSQKQKYKEVIQKAKIEIGKIQRQMNASISPYYWNIRKANPREWYGQNCFHVHYVFELHKHSDDYLNHYDE